ncbi:MAG: TlpA disulfide reductase family protein [Nitrospirota bacterium]
MRNKGNKALILLIILLLVAVFVILLITERGGEKVITVGNPAPDVRLVDADGNAINLSDLKGSVIFVHFWATWCESCTDEMPSIQQLSNIFSDNSEFRLITVIYRDSSSNVMSYMDENHYSFPVYFNPDNTAARKFGITGVPESFVIDRNGILREKIIGPSDWDSTGMLTTFRNLLNERA